MYLGSEYSRNLLNRFSKPLPDATFAHTCRCFIGLVPRCRTKRTCPWPNAGSPCLRALARRGSEAPSQPSSTSSTVIDAMQFLGVALALFQFAAVDTRPGDR